MSALIHLSQTEGLPPPSLPAPTLSQSVPMPHPPPGRAVSAVGPGPSPAPQPSLTALRSCPQPARLPVDDTPGPCPLISLPLGPGTRSDAHRFRGRRGTRPAGGLSCPRPPDLGRGYSLGVSPLLCPALSPLSDLSSSALSLGIPPTPFQGRAFSTKGRLRASPAGRGAQILMRVSCPLPRGGPSIPQARISPREQQGAQNYLQDT